ncbi:hypothetical protein EYF80_054778 [Liparis tanakae]|uniref:Uncharacterized protein n=1 Tax=Liparis tanakae TaxID=230148 RepID=A0A4Z2F270_9TELE|nr:hypothetical protein EYF80_054778 [Liparis tanakae]
MLRLSVTETRGVSWRREERTTGAWREGRQLETGGEDHRGVAGGASAGDGRRGPPGRGGMHIQSDINALVLNSVDGRSCMASWPLGFTSQGARASVWTTPAHPQAGVMKDDLIRETSCCRAELQHSGRGTRRDTMAVSPVQLRCDGFR